MDASAAAPRADCTLRLPPFALMVLMLGLLSCVAPATIDAYLPAFGAVGHSFGVTPAQVQQTLGVYMFCYAVMLLLHGTLSDSLGRRPVVLTTLVCYIGGSLMAASAPSFEWFMAARVLQGLSAGAGVVLGFAIVRDCYDELQSRRAMSYLIMVFNLSPALAPIIGGHLAAAQNWRSIFLLLTALAAAALALCAMFLPETLVQAKRQPFSPSAILRQCLRVLRMPRFFAMAFFLSLLIGAQAFLIGAAPDFITRVLKLPETAFAYLFIPLVVGAMLGALFAARMVGRLSDAAITRVAYALMGCGCLVHAIYLSGAQQPALAWAVIPPGVFTWGLAMCMPSMTAQILGRAPALSGTASSLLGFMQMATFAAVSGWCVPLVYGRPFALAAAMLACVAISLAGWTVLTRTPRR